MGHASGLTSCEMNQAISVLIIISEPFILRRAMYKGNFDVRRTKTSCNFALDKCYYGYPFIQHELIAVTAVELFLYIVLLYHFLIFES